MPLGLTRLGVMAAAVCLAAGRARRLALTGAVVTVVANVYMAAAFGSASFVQPGIGRAYLRGAPSIEELNATPATDRLSWRRLRRRSWSL